MSTTTNLRRYDQKMFAQWKLNFYPLPLLVLGLTCELRANAILSISIGLFVWVCCQWVFQSHELHPIAAVDWLCLACL